MIGLAISAAGAAAAVALTLGAYHPRCGLFGPVIGRGSRRTRALYLTFDDGPNHSATERILETLAERGVPAAFFMVGAHVRRRPELAMLVAQAGHEVGNHTHTHLKLHLCRSSTIRREIEEAHRAITDAVGRPPRSFRAPHGYRNPLVAPIVRGLGYQVFGWTFGVCDSARPGSEEIRRRVRARLRPGAIILLHDGDGYDPHGDRRQTADALPGIIDDAQRSGYTFRPLRELLSNGGHAHR